MPREKTKYKLQCCELAYGNIIRSEKWTDHCWKPEEPEEIYAADTQPATSFMNDCVADIWRSHRTEEMLPLSSADSCCPNFADELWGVDSTAEPQVTGAKFPWYPSLTDAAGECLQPSSEEYGAVLHQWSTERTVGAATGPALPSTPLRTIKC